MAGLQRILLNVRSVGAARGRADDRSSNASKHTPPSGTIDISVRLEPSDQGGASAIIAVQDTGEGMSQDFIERDLFAPFAQADSFSAGAGLGMSIVKGIVAEMDGEIVVTSERGVGTSAQIRSACGD